MNTIGIGNRIVNLRKYKNWSQRELARRVGMSPSVMNRIELEERPIKDFELDILASVLETTTDYLLGREVYERIANYDSQETCSQKLSLSGMDHIPKQLVKGLQEVHPEDLEEIQKHIEYIIYRRKGKI